MSLRELMDALVLELQRVGTNPDGTRNRDWDTARYYANHLAREVDWNIAGPQTQEQMRRADLADLRRRDR